jgi:hypothetical protein
VPIPGGFGMEDDRPEAAISLIVPTVLDRFVQQAALQVLQGPMGRNVQRA